MIVILGAKGQVGSALARLLGSKCIPWSREELDLSLPEPSIRKRLDAIRPVPDAIINAAAYTQVDKAESERNTAYAINGSAPGSLAAWCRDHGIPLVHYSTDYVFNGSGTRPHYEDDATNPLNAYGQSKKAGETAIKGVGGKHLIIRTSWVYDEMGKNFLNTMLNLGRDLENLSVVNDQYGSPTYATDLAKATLAMLEKARTMPQFPSGTYHLCNSGETTWYGFAKQIFMLAEIYGDALSVQHIRPITTPEYPTPAARPANSRLSCDKAKRVFGITLPSWQDSLNACMKQRYANLIYAA